MKGFKDYVRKPTTMRLLQAIRKAGGRLHPAVVSCGRAGRYMPEYRARCVRSIRSWTSAAPRSLRPRSRCSPLQKFPDLDAGIIFSDILLLTEPMGIKVEFVKNERPRPSRNPIATLADVEGAENPSNRRRDLPSVPRRDPPREEGNQGFR